MSLINTEIKPFKATAYQKGKFVDVTDANLKGKGKWSVVFFYPADFTFVCPTELEDLADNYAEFKKLGRRDLQRLDRHSLQPQGVARHVGRHQEDRLRDGR
jgi:alkyl hydroperoxide reductase subunit AhpC